MTHVRFPSQRHPWISSDGRPTQYFFDFIRGLSKAVVGDTGAVDPIDETEFDAVLETPSFVDNLATQVNELENIIDQLPLSKIEALENQVNELELLLEDKNSKIEHLENESKRYALLLS